MTAVSIHRRVARGQSDATLAIDSDALRRPGAARLLRPAFGYVCVRPHERSQFSPIDLQNQRDPKMKRLIVIASLFAISAPAVAQTTPDPRDFYFCASFYRWFAGQLNGETKLREHVARSETLFDAGSVALTDGVRAKEMVAGSAQRMRATIDQGRQNNLTLGELFKVVDGECWSKQSQHAVAILTKITQVSAAQQPFFELGLPSGQVPAADIASRVEAIRKRPDAQAGDQKEVVIYSFERRLGDKLEIVHHVATKDSSAAHPAIILMRIVREGQGRQPVMTFDGSFAGSKASYEMLYQAFVLMNQAR